MDLVLSPPSVVNLGPLSCELPVRQAGPGLQLSHLPPGGWQLTQRAASSALYLRCATPPREVVLGRQVLSAAAWLVALEALDYYGCQGVRRDWFAHGALAHGAFEYTRNSGTVARLLVGIRYDTAGTLAKEQLTVKCKPRAQLCRCRSTGTMAAVTNEASVIGQPVQLLQAAARCGGQHFFWVMAVVIGWLQS